MKSNSTMTKQYELTVLYHPDLSAGLLDECLDKMKSSVEKLGGSIISVENEGVKRLAYPIRGKDRATYMFYILVLPDHAPTELSSWLNVDEDVLRYLMVSVNVRKAKPLAKHESTSQAA